MSLKEKDVTEYFIAQYSNDSSYFYCVKASSSFYHRFSDKKVTELKNILRLVEGNRGTSGSYEDQKTYCSQSTDYKIINGIGDLTKKVKQKFKRYYINEIKGQGLSSDGIYWNFEDQQGKIWWYHSKATKRKRTLEWVLKSKSLRLEDESYKYQYKSDSQGNSKILKTHTKLTENNMEISFKEKAKIIKEEKRSLIILTKETLNGQGEFIPAKEFFYDTGILEPIKAGIKFNKPVLLEGETGVGKTASVRFLAHETNNGFRRLNLSGSTTTDEFVGRWKLNKNREMEWIDGVLIEAMRKGYWLLCDEINAALPEITFVLHSLLDDDNYVVLSQKDGEIVRPHPRFRFFASMNPNYSGTHELNHALRDRFPIVVTVEYPDKPQERKIVITQSGYKNTEIVNKMIDVAHRVRAGYKKQVIESPFSTRRLIDWAKLISIFGIEKSFEYSVLNKLHEEDRKAVLDIADAIFPGDMFKSKLKV